METYSPTPTVVGKRLNHSAPKGQIEQNSMNLSGKEDPLLVVLWKVFLTPLAQTGSPVNHSGQ